ncbi:hypothetical protein AMTR_s00099p00040400 [Amborella trichopoda]|uniref:Uncharacterized protein n=1 Tax=Amborella trichopoda TaxID=13333 RepID=W1NVQ0_AMBTC|nr:hypothetical protein AMTR_s00099p00040400 [Amborella trichopoda]
MENDITDLIDVRIKMFLYSLTADPRPDTALAIISIVLDIAIVFLFVCRLEVEAVDLPFSLALECVGVSRMPPSSTSLPMSSPTRASHNTLTYGFIFSRCISLSH